MGAINDQVRTDRGTVRDVSEGRDESLADISATKLQGDDFPSSPSDGQILRFNGSSGAWEHKFSTADVFNVKDFGAVGDGVTDDVAAFQAAIDAAVASAGGTVLIPPPESKYLIGTTLTISDAHGFSMVSMGIKAHRPDLQDALTIQWSGGAGEMIHVTDHVEDIYLAGFTLDGNSKTATHGLRLQSSDTSVRGLELDRVEIQGCQTGLSLDSVANDVDEIFGRNVAITDCDVGLLVDTSTGEVIRFSNVWIISNDTVGVDYQAGGALFVNGGSVSNNGIDFRFGSDAKMFVARDGISETSTLKWLEASDSLAPGSLSYQRSFYCWDVSFKDNVPAGTEVVSATQSARWAFSNCVFGATNAVTWDFTGANRVTEDNVVDDGDRTVTYPSSYLRIEARGGTTNVAEIGHEDDFWELRDGRLRAWVGGTEIVDILGNRCEINDQLKLNDEIQHRAFQSFVDGDATPAINTANHFKTANTGATTITGFDNGVDGKKIVVVFGDANTTIDFTGTNLKGNGGADWSPAQNDHMTCVYDGTNWYCDISDNTA